MIRSAKHSSRAGNGTLRALLLALGATSTLTLAAPPTITNRQVSPGESSAVVTWTTNQPATSRVDFVRANCTSGCSEPSVASVAAIEFDEASGLQALDASGSGHAGTLENGATRNPAGHRGGALETNGVAGNVDLGGLDIAGNALTIALWFKADDFDVADARLVSKASGLGDANHYWMVGTAGQELRFRLKTSTTGTTTLVSSGAALAAGVWTHVAATYDGAVMRLYRNGVLVGSTSKTGPLATNPTVEAWIGDNPGGGRSFDGLIDEVRLYARALSATDLAIVRDQRYYGHAVDDPALTTSHSVLLEGLSPETQYHFSVVSVNAGGEVTAATDATFTTNAFTGSPLASDDFHLCTLDTGRWTFVDPLGDASVTIAGATAGDGHVEIFVPGGTNHDPWTSNDAPRIMQAAPDGDFTLEVRFDSQLGVAYQQQGVMVEQGPDRWLRFDFVHTGTGVMAFAASSTNGVPVAKITRPIFTGPSPVPLYLRVTRAGDTWTHQHSTNGTSWVSNGSFSSVLDVTAAGIFGANLAADGAAPAVTVRADYFFETSQPISPEDGAAAGPGFALDVATVGSGSVTRSPDQPTYVCAPVVSLRATPEPGWQFAGWSGALSGTANPTFLTMHGARQVTATFTAAAGAPQISGVVVTPGDDRATVRWVTNEPASSQVQYGTTASYGSSVANAALTTTHELLLTGLTPGTEYHFRVVSVDSASLSTATADATFTTEPAVFVSDDFNRCDLDPRWSFVDPVGDASYDLVHGGTPDARLRISVPAGVAHDPWLANDAPRIMQPALDRDFQVEVKMESSIGLPYQQQGVIVEEDGGDWLRLDFVSDGGSLRAVAVDNSAGVPRIRIYKAIDALPSPAPIWLRVTRTGDVWRHEHSLDGATWISNGTFTKQLEVTAVGVFAGNAGSGGDVPAHVAEFDYFFSAASPLLDEDGGVPGPGRTLTRNLGGQGQVVADPDRAEYYCDEPVRLTAVPAPGWQFDTWSGDLQGTANPQELPMSSNRTVQANFTQAVGPPAISDLAVHVRDTEATVTWRTNEPATSRVDFGLSPLLGRVAESTELATEHALILDSLSPESTYYFVVSSTDAEALTTSTPLETFVTWPSNFSSDDFNRHHLRTDRWTFVDPYEDSAYSISGAGTGDAKVTIHVPAGRSHDPWSQGLNVPRLMQTANDVDFQIETRLDSVLGQRIQQQGVIVEQDETRWMRFDFVFNGSKVFAFAASVSDGVATVKAMRDVRVGPSPVPLYLRVTRQGDVFTHQYSLDGSSWITTGVFTFELEVRGVGIYGGNWGAHEDAPALDATFDYFFNTESPVQPEDGAQPPADTQGPAIQAIRTISGKTFFRVSWITDEPTTGTLEYGATTAYELGQLESATLDVDHAVEALDLETGLDYHFRIVARDAAGNVTTTGDLIVRVEGIQFTFFYGATQPFGHRGVPQSWVNVLGNVADLDGVRSLTYSLNGGPESPLTIGHDLRRLASDGDFNAEIDWNDLQQGPNEVRLTAVDRAGNVESASMIVDYDEGNLWPRDYDVDWSSVQNLQDVGQVVDGEWSVVPGGVRAWPMYYDRLIAIGDHRWTDYEVTVPITVYELDPRAYSPISGAPAVGLILRWPGHVAWDNAQPRWGHYPLGAATWAVWHNAFQGLEILGNEAKQIVHAPKTIELGVTYVYRAQVTTNAGTGAAIYRLKVWRQSDPEPVGWDLEMEQPAEDGPESGSLLLVSHYVDAILGDVTVRSLAPCDGEPRTLTLQVTGAGAVERSLEAPDYRCNETLELTALPEPGFRFSHWSGDLTGSANPASITMDADRTVTATFVVATGPPTISDIAVVPGDTWATITWRTDEPATSRVDYGVASVAESTAQRTGLVTEHSVTLTGLLPETTYRFAVSSVDNEGSSAGSAEATFATTAPAPVAFASDDFNSCELYPRWTFVDPLGDASYDVVGVGSGDAKLRIHVPAGVSHNPWATNDAPRVMQPAEDMDFRIVARFSSPLTERYQEHGILVEQDAQNWIRFDFYSNGTQVRAFSAAVANGAPATKFDTLLTAGLPPHLSVTRHGDQWTTAHSHDGINWYSTGSFSQALDVTAVGVFAGNVAHGSQPAPAYTAVIDYLFEESSHVDPEDGGVPGAGVAIATTTSGGGSIALDPDQDRFYCGEDVRLTAVPDAGRVLHEWSGALSGFANPQTLSMTADRSVHATFVPDTLPPVIDAVEVETGDTWATITWVTNKPATSRVNFGATASYGQLVESSTLVVEHSVTLGDLNPQTTYHFEVVSVDEQENQATAGDFTFETDPPVPGPFSSDDFNACALDAAWTFVNPLNDASYALLGAGSGNARLRINVPAGVSHDPWTSLNAPRVMQPALDDDLQVVVKFDSLVSAAYQEQGVLVVQDANRWVRFDIHHDGTSPKILAATHVSGVSTVRMLGPLPAAYATSPQYMRITRNGSLWTQEHSLDGTSWVTSGSFSLPMVVQQLGVFGGNAGFGGAAPAHTVLVDFVLEGSIPLASEDVGTPPTPGRRLTLQRTGSGAVTRSPNQSFYYCAETVTVTATPDPGWVFSNWSGALTGISNPGNVVVDQDKSVTAHFVAASSPPVIDQIVVTPTTTTATVEWVTNEPATGRVDYGLTASYGQFVTHTALSTSHSLTLTGLEPETTYHFRIGSADSQGSASQTGDLTFDTEPEPPGPFVSDDFDAAALDPLVWTFVNPLGDASHSLTGAGTANARLTIHVPGGSAHEPWTRNDAPRVMQAADDTDFQIEVKLESLLNLAYQMQGIIVEQGPDDWLRFDVYSNGTGAFAFASSVAGGVPAPKINRNIGAGPVPSPLYLRVTRTTNLWTYEYSTDRVSWALAGSFTRALVVSAVGVFGGNVDGGGGAPATTAVFDYFFDGDAPIGDEDGQPYTPQSGGPGFEIVPPMYPDLPPGSEPPGAPDPSKSVYTPPQRFDLAPPPD